MTLGLFSFGIANAIIIFSTGILWAEVAAIVITTSIPGGFLIVSRDWDKKWSR